LAPATGGEPVRRETEVRIIAAADADLRVIGFGQSEQFLANRFALFFGQQHGSILILFVNLGNIFRAEFERIE